MQRSGMKSVNVEPRARTDGWPILIGFRWTWQYSYNTSFTLLADEKPRCSHGDMTVTNQPFDSWLPMLRGCSGVMIVIITCCMSDRLLKRLESAVWWKIDLFVALYLHTIYLTIKLTDITSLPFIWLDTTVNAPLWFFILYWLNYLLTLHSESLTSVFSIVSCSDAGS